jgi:hypothetical protein
MPDYRLIHRRALRGEKVGTLTDFERGVWLAYLLIADDYGVMPFDAGELAKAIWLKGKPHKAVQRALERVRDAGLIQTWTHQGAVYCYAYDWQEWQNVRHPRGTIEPCPPPAVVDRCKPKTQQLFAEHSRNNAEEFPQESGDVSEELRQMPRLARAGGRETLTLTQTLTANANANPSRGMGAGVMAGSLPREHLSHACCGRVCVPNFLHSDFIRAVGGAAPGEALNDFYAKTLEAIPDDQPIGDDPVKFWRAAFSARFGSAQSGQGTRTTALAKATAGFLGGAK